MIVVIGSVFKGYILTFLRMIVRIMCGFINEFSTGVILAVIQMLVLQWKVLQVSGRIH